MAQLSERIAALEAKLKTLKARQQRDESRKRTLESRRIRKADTRRKILVGAVVLARIEQGRLTRAELTAWLDQALSRADDRRLFDLPTQVSIASSLLQSVAKNNNPHADVVLQRTPASMCRE